MRDGYTGIEVVTTIAPVAVGTTGTGQTGTAVDLRGADAAAVVFHYGAILATGADFTATVLEGDTTGGSFTAVADADLIPTTGAETSAGLAPAARVDGSTENVALHVGYKGTKRYIKAMIASTATAGTPVSAVVVKSHLHRRGFTPSS